MPVSVRAKRSIRRIDGVGPPVVAGFRLHLGIAERRAAADLAGIFKLAFLCGRADNKHFLLDRPSRDVPKERAQSQGSLQDPAKIVSSPEKTLEISVFRNPPSAYGSAGSRAGNDVHRHPYA